MTMLKSVILGSVAAIGLAVAAPALAVATFSQDITSSLIYGPQGATADFGHTPLRGSEPLVNGFFDFQDTFTFTYDMPGTASGSVTNNRVRVSAATKDIDFTGITFNGTAGDVLNVNGLSVASFDNVDFTSGLQSIVINGRSTGGASFGGNIEILNAVVPEPATWGLMALGFGLVGAAARGRRGRHAVHA